MAEPADLILPMLRDMCAENGARHEALLARLDKREAAQVSFRQALGADTLMSRLLTGEFEEPIEALERRVRELEATK